MDHHHFGYIKKLTPKITKLTQQKFIYLFIIIISNNKKTRASNALLLTWKNESRNAQNPEEPEAEQEPGAEDPQEAAAEPEHEPGEHKDHLLVDSSAELVQEFLVISFRDFEQLVDEVLAFQ